ncbi:MAG TPA: chaperone modulator CbpM [Ferruginibacter sp.]|nr:chaperone modulator CbpM [Ferruginibacter sp.]
MQQQDNISAEEFCIYHHIEMSFIHDLNDEGLIELARFDEKLFVPLQQLPLLEKMTRLHYEMDINIAGIESITHLLNEMEAMQQQITQLHNKLRLYEGENEF